VYLNPAAEKIYGRTASAFYADPRLFINIVHPEDRPRVAKMLPELIEQGTMTIQYRIVRPDGEVRWLEDKTAIARDADGRPVRFDGVANDITERKAREAQFQAEQEQLDEFAMPWIWCQRWCANSMVKSCSGDEALRRFMARGRGHGAQLP
jgi:PAS domain S-box-containing protein